MLTNQITPRGGTEGATLQIIEGLHGLGVEFLAVVLHGIDTQSRGALAAIDVTVAECAPGFGAQFACVCEMIRKERPDLIHAALFDAEVVACLAGALFGVPVVRSLVTVQYGREATRVAVSPMKLKVVRIVDRVMTRFGTFRFHAVSAAAADAATRALGVPSARITVVPRGRDSRALGPVTSERRHRERASLGLDPQVPMLFNATRLYPAKGHVHLVEAFARVRRTNTNAVLVIAGLEGPSTSAVRAKVEQLGLGDAVLVLGVRDDVPDLLCAADVFVFSSLWEGLPGAVLEAMAMRVPVVAFSVPAVIEALGDAGVLVPIGDVEGFAHAVDALLRDAPRRAETARRAHERFEQRFTLQASLDGMQRFYASVVADASSEYRDRFGWVRRVPHVCRRFRETPRSQEGP